MTTRPPVGDRPAVQSGPTHLSTAPDRLSPHVYYHSPRPLKGLGTDRTAYAAPLQEDVIGPPFKKQKLKTGSRTLRWGMEMEKHESFLLISDPNRNANPAFIRKKIRVSRSPIFALRPVKATTNRGAPEADSIRKRAAVTEPVSTKSYVAEAPSFAPRYREAGPADFSPWAGRHAEDALNELTTRNGCYDKIQASQNESGTARPSVWSNLKHKAGLQFLSSLFALTLDQRQLCGTVSTTNTFKPPPRVTLTDTKREAWLKDLSNPSIPLRRLSRTIPHGVRGKLLLEHCSNKEIPISRAIWLAKCVGANEIRASKRKGTGGIFTVGGESKWIKEWTSNVEQHLAIIVEAWGRGLKSRIYYSIQLVSHLFLDGLIDRQQHLDWLLACLDRSDIDHLPVWLVLTRIHWQEIMAHIPNGRRVVEAMLQRLHMLHEDANLIANNIVIQQLNAMLKSMLVFSPACFLLPLCWLKFSDNIKIYLIDENASLSPYFTGLSVRNLNLQDTSAQRHIHHQAIPAQCLIALLDSLSDRWDFEVVAKDCLSSSYDHALLVKSCLEWSATLYRRGRFRVYAAARLLRIWNRNAVNIQRHILDFIGANTELRDLYKPSIYKLLAELTLSSDFSLSKYLQWLMARLNLRKREKPDANGPCDIRLLFELPLHGQPAHVINLRHSILATLKASASEEDDLLLAVERRVSEQTLGYLHSSSALSNDQQYDGDLALLSQTTKASLGHSIRTALYLLEKPTYWIASQTMTQHHTADIGLRAQNIMSLTHFHTIREVLEQLEEHPVLADIMGFMCNNSKGIFLTALADTVNYHFDVLQALGAAEGLFAGLYNVLKSLPRQEIPERAFLESLIDLGGRLHHAKQEVDILQHRLSSLEPRLSAAASSPISDTMVEAVQSTATSFAGEMDQMLSSGTSMDKQTLGRIFGTITDQVEQSWNNSAALIRLSNILGRLRAFNHEMFDGLATSWLEYRLLSLEPGRISLILTPLVCARVFSVQSVLEQLYFALGAGQPSQDKASTALDLLRLMLEDNAEPESSEDCRFYRIQDQQCRVFGLVADLSLKILNLAIQACAFDDRLPPDILETLKSQPFISLLRLILNQASGNTVSVPSLDVRARRIIGAILLEYDSEQRTPFAAYSQVSRLVERIHNFNVSFCRLRLEAIMGDANVDEGASTVSDVLIEQLGCSSDGRIELWARLVSGLSTKLASSMCEWAAKAFVSRLRSDMRPNAGIVPDYSEKLLVIMEAAAFRIPYDKETSKSVEHVSEALSALLSSSLLLGTHSTRYIGFLLRLVAIYRVIFRQTESTQIALTNLSLNLGYLLLQPMISTQTALSMQIFDSFAVFSDFVSHKDRTRGIKPACDGQDMQDSRLLFTYEETSRNQNEGERLWLVPSPEACNAHENHHCGTITMQPYNLRRWEHMQDTTPVIAGNDTSLSLALFGTRCAVL